MTPGLTNKRAIVTGAASGIGRATAAALAEAGARVAGIDVQDSDNARNGRDVTHYTADVTSSDDVRRTVGRVASALGGIDIVVNSAGIEETAALDELSCESFDRMYAVNVRGTMLVTQAALPHLAPGARVINLASELAYLGRAGSSAYCATKGAILSMTRAWARELAPNILVNAVAPGPIDTPLLGFAAMSAGQRALELANPLGRIGRPDEVAAAILFLAGPGAGFITGQCLAVDGGAAMR